MLMQIYRNWKLIEKYWCGYIQKWVSPLRSQDIKFGFISRRNQWSKLIFGVLIKIQEIQKLL